MAKRRAGDGWHVVAYASKMMDVHQKNYQITEKECLAVVFACKRFRHYLSGKKFTVVTDHSALLHLCNLKDPQGRLGRWQLLLQEFEFTVVHRKGRLHQDADLLSRFPNDPATVAENDCDIPLYNYEITAYIPLMALLRFLVHL